VLAPRTPSPRSMLVARQLLAPRSGGVPPRTTMHLLSHVFRAARLRDLDRHSLGRDVRAGSTVAAREMRVVARLRHAGRSPRSRGAVGARRSRRLLSLRAILLPHRDDRLFLRMRARIAAKVNLRPLFGEGSVPGAPPLMWGGSSQRRPGPYACLGGAVFSTSRAAGRMDVFLLWARPTDGRGPRIPRLAMDG
jgi:hypothetical protein